MGGPALPDRGPKAASSCAQYGESELHRCRQVLRDEAAAWDAMHETFVRAIRYRTSFKSESHPRTWLYSIATRVCMDELRQRGRGRELVEEAAIPLEKTPA